MDIQNRKSLKSAARQRLSQADTSAKIALVYAAVTVGASLIINAVRMLLGSQISQFGGLQNMGMRSVLSTMRTMLPILLNFLLMCLGLGFTGAMLRIGREQYASLNSLRIGFARFWVLLRVTLLQGGLYMLACMAAYMISMQIFFLTPMSRGLLSALSPMLNQPSADIMSIIENPQIMDQLVSSLIPLYGLMIVIFLAVAAPIYYRYILTKYIILDKPASGAFAAMRESRMLMRGNCMKFFKLDLSLWPYYLANAIALLICYAATILTLFGVTFPVSPLIVSAGCFLVYLVLCFFITLFQQPHKEVTHALAYESLRPKEQATGGAVLGNIFDLARDQMDNM